jgi:hypothetical protein
MKGGNTDELYQGVGSEKKEDDGRWKMAESLRKQHPDIVKVTRRWNRFQHSVNYSVFRKNELKLKKGIEIPKGVNNFGMVLEINRGKHVDRQSRRHHSSGKDSE